MKNLIKFIYILLITHRVCNFVSFLNDETSASDEISVPLNVLIMKKNFLY